MKFSTVFTQRIISSQNKQNFKEYLIRHKPKLRKEEIKTGAVEADEYLCLMQKRNGLSNIVEICAADQRKECCPIKEKQFAAVSSLASRSPPTSRRFPMAAAET
ncbi:hypothetical protein HZH68_003993 [Vespula germanica]|uniref:Uncharacterized protein n=1 Tax=Vespula germanica TaxID=30212 RepID=A0A834KN19_VESGE|nr:hypothetical protein HZH68_003993 [Vespula germanica]